MVRHKVELLTDFLTRCGPERSIDVDDAGMRLALDVVSSVSSPHHNLCSRIAVWDMAV